MNYTIHEESQRWSEIEDIVTKMKHEMRAETTRQIVYLKNKLLSNAPLTNQDKDVLAKLDIFFNGLKKSR